MSLPDHLRHRPYTGLGPKIYGFDVEKERKAQVYVFCVLGKDDQLNVDPLDVDQWTFYVAATEVSNGNLG